jgi:cobalt-zinc-cadmium efflux system membrane fusion protein
MAMLIDNTQLQLQVAVFEKDLPGIKPGMKIRFRPTERGEYYSATLLSVGQSVDTESKNVICIAEIADLEKGNFVNNGYAEALIITRTDTVDAVPEEAILRSGGADFLLSLASKEDSSFLLRKIQVKPGRIENGYREITEPATVSGILTHGAYNIVLE